MRNLIAAILFFFVSACVAGTDKPLFAQSPEEIFVEDQVVELAKAAKRGDIEKIDRLVTAGVDVNAKGKGGLNPLTFAMLGRNLFGFEALLDHGADPNQLYGDGENVTYYVASANFVDDSFMVALVERGVDLDVTGSKKTPIYHAVFDDSLDRLQLMVDAGADVEHRDFSGNTPLLHAASMNQWGAVTLLLRNGADHDAKNRWGNGLSYFFERSAQKKGVGGPYYEALEMYYDIEERKPAVCEY